MVNALKNKDIDNINQIKDKYKKIEVEQQSRYDDEDKPFGRLFNVRIVTDGALDTFSVSI